MSMKAVIFDAYGTLLDVHSAMEQFAPQLGPDWRDISNTWRTKQVEYSWIRTIAGDHRDFARLTHEALVFAAAKHGIGDQGLIAQVEQAYRKLKAYPDARPALDALRAKGLRCAILSNGETAMLDEGVHHAGLDGALDAVMSVDAVGVFKPNPVVYQMAVDRFGVPAQEMAFLSSNPWDAFGAARFGFRVYWVNRIGQPEEYGLHSAATAVLSGLQTLPDLLA